MTWNYRIIKYDNGTGFGLHEVYYDERGVPNGMNADPASFVGMTAEEVRSALMMAKRDADKRPVLDEPRATKTPVDIPPRK